MDDFNVIDVPSAYNWIAGRLLLNSFRTTLSNVQSQINIILVTLTLDLA